jgi:two-component system, OmpR family, phosphate regulon sensor histidine kinase PhoR
MDNIGLLIVVALLAGITAAAATSFYYWRRTARRVRRLSLLVKRLTMGDLTQNLDDLLLAKNGELADLSRAIIQLALELREVISRVERERNTMSALLQNMSDGIISADAQGRIINLNEAAQHILGLPTGVATEGRSLMQVVRDYEINNLVRQTLQDAQQRVQVLDLGSGRPHVQVKVTLVPDQDTSNALVVLQDLTEIMRLERIRRDFVANISHELRTPLASVKLMVETLQNVIEDDPSAAQEFLPRIDTEIDGLTQLVRELLELSRIESGQIKLSMKSVDIRKQVEQAAERMRPQAGRRGLEVVVNTPEDDSLPNTLVDPDRIQQVLINLIHNAIKFTPVGGKIIMSVDRYAAARAGDRLLVQVRDTGVGIPPDDIGRIFERFYKVDKARTGNEAGTGLGLAIAKHIIQAHNGEIWAESQYGSGSIFSFTIPTVPVY